MSSPRPTPLQTLVAQDCNRMAWRGQTGHYEVWFLTLAHRESKTGFWIRYTLESPEAGHGPPYAELWFCRSDGKTPAKTFGIHRRCDIANLHSQQRPFVVRISGSELGHSHASGSLSGDGHNIRWDLHWDGQSRPHLLLPRALYSNPMGIAETIVLSPNHSIAVSGTIEIDGERYELHQTPGGQSHLWGKKHAYGWAWARCNAFDREDEKPTQKPQAVFESLTVRLRRGPVVLPLTMMSMYPDGFDGKEVAFKEWTDLPLTRAEYRTGSYVLSAEGPRTGLEVQFSCSADDMLRTEYVDPDGTPAFNHYAGAASCTMLLKRRLCPGAAWRIERTFRSEQGAQFEWAGRAGDSLVRKRHVLVND